MSPRAPKGRTTIIAEALEAQGAINRSLAKIDLRTVPLALRSPVKEARKAGSELEYQLTLALQVDAQAMAS